MRTSMPMRLVVWFEPVALRSAASQAPVDVHSSSTLSISASLAKLRMTQAP